MFLVKAKDSIEPGVPLRPGYFHLMQIPHDAPPWPIAPSRATARTWSPADWIFEKLGAGDLRERRPARRDRRGAREDEAAYEREKAEQKQEPHGPRQGHRRTPPPKVRVCMNDSVPWSQNVDGRRRTK